MSHVLLRQLREGSLDFVIGVRPQGPLESSIRAQPLFANQLNVGARRGHPLRNVKSLRELVDANWAIFTPAGWSGAIIPDVFEKNDLQPPRSIVRCESYVALLTILAGT
jgi:LysR family transcriptional regulator of abg operon